MNKKLTLFLVILSVVAMMSATVAQAQDSVELVWWTLERDQIWMDADEAIIAEFEAANPNITITIERRSTDGHKEALRVAAGTDAFPDIFFMWSGLGLGGEFIDAGMSADLTEYYEQYGWDELLSPPVVAAATQYGGYHGVMESIRGQAIYYRRDLFEAAGITEEPTTWEELIAANDALVEIGVAPFEFGGTVNWHLMRLLDAQLEYFCGAETHDALKSMELSWAEEACVDEAFTSLATWSEDYIVEGFAGIDNNEATQLWYAGIAAMALEGDWMVNVLASDGQDLDNYGIFPIPNGTGRLYSFSEGNYIGSNSEHKDEAAAFLNYRSSTEVQTAYLGVYGAVSINQHVIAGDDQPALNDEWLEIFASSTGAYVNGDQAFPLNVTTEYWRIMNLVSIGELAPEEAGDLLQEFIDNNM